MHDAPVNVGGRLPGLTFRELMTTEMAQKAGGAEAIRKMPLADPDRLSRLTVMARAARELGREDIARGHAREYCKKMMELGKYFHAGRRANEFRLEEELRMARIHYHVRKIMQSLGFRITECGWNTLQAGDEKEIMRIVIPAALRRKNLFEEYYSFEELARRAQELGLEDELKQVVRKAILFSLEQKKPKPALISSISKYDIDEARQVLDGKLMCGKLEDALVIAKACLKEDLREVAMVLISRSFARRRFYDVKSYAEKAYLMEDAEVLGMVREAYDRHMESGDYDDAENLARLFGLKDEEQKARSYRGALYLIEQVSGHSWYVYIKPGELDAVKAKAIEVVKNVVLKH